MSDGSYTIHHEVVKMQGDCVDCQIHLWSHGAEVAHGVDGCGQEGPSDRPHPEDPVMLPHMRHSSGPK